MTDERLRMLLDRIHRKAGRAPPRAPPGPPRRPGPEATWEPSLTPEAQEDPLAWFPHATLRAPQRRFLLAAREAFAARKVVVAHLPTGVGKTSVALAAALSAPLAHVFYLTNRQTQHDVVIAELRRLADGKARRVGYVDLIGKQQMCVNEAVSHEQVGRRFLPVEHHRFIDACASAIEAKACRWFKAAMAGAPVPPMSALEMVDHGRAHGRCPYYLAARRMPESRLVIGDYNMVLTDQRRVHLDRLGVAFEACGVIVDEAHNIADRVRDLYTRRLTARNVEGAASLVRRVDAPSARFLRDVHRRLVAAQERLAAGADAERAVAVEELAPPGPEGAPPAKALERSMLALKWAAQTLKNRDPDPVDLPWRVFRFLSQWFDDLPQVRVVRRQDGRDAVLQLRLIDPSPITRPLLTEARWVVLMSGTLHPTAAFAETLGLRPEEVVHVTESSPFPPEHRTVRFEASLTTRAAGRGQGLYDRYAAYVQATLGPGNAAVFAPSYAIARELVRRLAGTGRPVVAEEAGMLKEDRDAVLARLRRTKTTGSLLVAVFGGGFGEGVDFPDGLLPQIYLVGLPLATWNLETQGTVAHYEAVHGRAKGKELAYHIPAVTRAVQAAGRGIRGPTDRCVIHFVDSRYTEARFRRLLPPEYGARREGHR